MLILSIGAGDVIAQPHSLRFFGSGATDADRVKIPLDAPHRPVDVAGDFTLEFWMKALPGDNASTACVQGQDWFYGNILVDRDIFGPGDHGDYGIALADRRLMVGVETALGAYTLTFCGDRVVDDGQWHHIAVTRRSSDGMVRLWVDGQPDGQSGPNPNTGDISYRDGRATAYPDSDPYLVLGAEKHDYPGSLHYRGWMDELRLSTIIRYTGAFSPPAAPFTPDAQTAALYHFDEGSGTSLGDALGASPGLLSVGGSPPGPAWSTDVPFMAGPTNLLTNGSFEQGLPPWTVQGGSGVLDNSRARDGVWSLRLTNGQARYDNLSGLQADSLYTLTAWFYLDPASGGQDWGGIQLSVLGQDWSVLRQAVFTPDQRPLGHWFKEVLSFKAPPDGFVRVHLGTFGGPGWDLLYWLDDVRVFPQGPNQAPALGPIQWPGGGHAPLEVMVIVPADDPDGAVVYKSVDFGDGALYTSLTDTFRHIYGLAGNYLLRVEALDDRGATAREEFQLPITAAPGTPDLRITLPTPDPQWITQDSSVVLGGTGGGWIGPLFWINERTMEHGWQAAPDPGSWALPAIRLAHGENVLAVQSRNGQGHVVIARLRVLREDPTLSGPRIYPLSTPPATVETYTLWESRFDLETRGHDAFLPFGHLPGDSSGVTVQAIFVQGSDTLVQPAFYTQEQVPAGDDLAAQGAWYWSLRMGFPRAGNWQGTLIAEDRSGRSSLPLGQIQVTAGDNRGPIRVSEQDNRHFTYPDGTPFLPRGYNISVDQSLPALQKHLDDWSANGINYGRFWLSPASPFSDAWSSWATHHPMDNIGYLPPSMLTPERRYGPGDLSWKIAWPPVPGRQTPSMFRGFWSTVPVEPGRTYRLIGRVRLEDVQGPGGLVLKTGGWLGTADIQAGTGVWLTDSPLRGFSDWVYITGAWTAGSGDTRLPFLYLTLEDVPSGTVYLDQLTMHPLDALGRPGPNILDTWNANAHRYADPIECRKADFLLREAADRGMHYQAVILEKNDPILNMFGPHGRPDPAEGGFDAPAGSYLDLLYQAYWRHLRARWGWSTAVASWELVNEGAPGSYFDLLERLSAFFTEDAPYPRMTTTSFWSEWVPEYWQASAAAFADVHAYIMTTGFLDGYELDGNWYSREELKRDPSLAIRAYGQRLSRDPERTKPVIIGETDLDQPGSQAPDPLLALDTRGLWLTDWIWGHLAAEGVCGLIWDNANLENNQLHGLYRPFAAVTDGLHTGRMPLFLPEVSTPDLRAWAFGQAPFDTLIVWVRHRELTWHRALTQEDPAPLTGAVSLRDLQPGRYLVESWDPLLPQDQPQYTALDTVGIDGILDLQLDLLEGHRVWRLFFQGPLTRLDPTTTEPELAIWPNPARDRLYFRIPEHTPQTRIILLDPLGRQVRSASPGDSGIDLQGLSSGYYIFLLETPTQRIFRPFTIITH